MSVRSPSSFVPDDATTDPAGPVDLLSRVLRELRLDSATYRSLRLRGEWRLRFDGPLRGVHIVVSGHPHLALDDGTLHPLGPGDLVILPRADAHTMSSSVQSRVRPISSMTLAARSPEVEAVFGDSGVETRIVCGVFFFADDQHPAVAGLPSCIHVPADARLNPWLDGLTTALVAEAVERGPGSEVVMARLSDALITRALRYHLETADEPGWLSGLRDPAIARALTAIHRDLGRPWTVAGLARESRLSRTSFAERFSRLVGHPPMEYLLDCRMRRAQSLLNNDRLTVEAIAGKVGYGSAAAFSAAFVRVVGAPPGAYRRAAMLKAAANRLGVPAAVTTAP